jgi:hypothetical protein
LGFGIPAIGALLRECAMQQSISLSIRANRLLRFRLALSANRESAYLVRDLYLNHSPVRAQPSDGAFFVRKLS